MNPANPNESKPAGPAPDAGGQAAVHYVQTQLHHARVSLKRTQIVCVLLLAIVLSYSLYLTSRWRKELDPKAAANSAIEHLSAEVVTHADALADQLKERAPAFIAGLPDLVLKELPEQRMALEARIQVDIKDYCLRASKEMEKHLDRFLEENKADIVSALRAPDNKEAFRALGVHLQDEVVAFISEKPAEGESIKEKIDHSMEILNRVEKQMDKLAAAKDLTPQEKKARRAIAIITHVVDKQIEKPVEKKE